MCNSQLGDNNQMSENDQMQVSILASSSSGNTTYIETPQHKILVDAGMSGKRVQDLMHSIGRDLKDVDSLLVTHEHRDHSSGVGVLARRYGMDVYANQPTWDAMASIIGNVPGEHQHLFEMGKTKTLGDIDVESFGVSHDAAAAQFYQFHHNDRSFAMLTDTGYVSDQLRGTLANANAYLVECNHDLEMLRMGQYPWSLKQRILSDTGHLSNEDGAAALMACMGQQTKKIFLGHLSQENNMKELAHLTVASIMKEHDYGVGTDFEILDTDPAIADPLFAV
ncbi:hypothetical protein FC69_GL001812 [Latilactobacillus fuchuensis DSM 14340 = JCM 11249]|uniref:Metallo-beta-lactamase domain-containing protein n=2 Tax=Latilactobacillus fuchuensis TaxID=164393 RepID=A0A0R1RXZ0_9LACO|nr:hypothetical protein FC69_GL001812 [Latilactobacillus fuchuensis DSM 14340 = JCM 11249]